MSTDARMTIAFTSCMSTDAFATSQPVWTDIARHKPDLLLLLGDSVYIDCPPVADGDHAHPSDPSYASDAFARHLLTLYRRQLAIAEFAALIANTPTLAIWDDHDFLWNDADSRWRDHPAYPGRMVLSSNLFQCWREALVGQPFPESTSDPRVMQNWSDVVDQIRYDPAMPGYSHAHFLDGQVWVHLTDGRSWRRKISRQLLGREQREQIRVVIANAPVDALHIIASGSTFSQHSMRQESWQSYPEDRQWLLDLASRHNVLMLSGDVHQLILPDPIPCGSKKFHEATASGAAVNFAPWRVGEKDSLGQFTQKYGLLQVDADVNGEMGLQLFDHGHSPEHLQRIWSRCF